MRDMCPVCGKERTLVLVREKEPHADERVTYEPCAECKPDWDEQIGKQMVMNALQGL